jgi:hypothetical protein
MTRNAQRPLAAKNVYLAALGLWVAFFNALLPPPTFSVVDNESATICSILAACVDRLLTSSDCNSEISRRDFSAVLSWLDELFFRH